MLTKQLAMGATGANAPADLEQQMPGIHPEIEIVGGCMFEPQIQFRGCVTTGATGAMAPVKF